MNEKEIHTALATLPQEGLSAYIRMANSFPMLTLEEEQSLGRRLFDDSDLEAARQLILSHLRFVIHVARSYSGYGLPQADLIQEGNIGLMKAVRRFNPEVGVRLVSFAVHWIKAEIHEYVLRNWKIAKVATTKAQRKLFFNLRKTKKHLGWLSKDEVDKVAQDLGVSTQDVLEMESRMGSKDLAFDITDDMSDERAMLAPAAYLEDNQSDFSKSIEEDNWESDATDKLNLALEQLDERSQDIIRARWLNQDDSKATLTDLATKYNISAERVRQLEKNAMKKLKVAIEL